MRTRVGYSGGTTPNPTYHRIGDHTETLQVDYDPAKIRYEDLLEVFWTSHRPTAPVWSRQYASAIFVHGDEQRRLAEASAERMRASLGPLFTEIVPFECFYVAEDYHQKYRLRASGEVFREFHAMYPDDSDLRDSTAAARANGYLDGWGSGADLEAVLPSLGLSAEGLLALRAAISHGH